ncbi:hypothetical protein [Halochromatium glycolicum]|jgi:hypothetical protein|uniref:Uncharacterized protein n=1 Tax=Halochromatium glycolicum TaxID=85075 RepID=A0AAJ0U3B0_9GAMM|nr:hypothetical protein [Halochromatium glycolicum]MBK1704022.1 hypothetical protein [Halochromatium glycolicum]NBC46599.1 hypothetical protein [Gammaproteobacteria bacterium]
MGLPTKKLDQIQPGMVLEADLYDPNGLVLLRAGTLINERSIRALKCWGITEAPVSLSGAPDTATAARHRSHEALSEMLDNQFALSNREHPAVQALYEICLERALQQH